MLSPWLTGAFKKSNIFLHLSHFFVGRDGGNGTATISTNMQFDREQQKYYLIPIITWDMRDTGSNEAMTGTNTLTVTIADINDNDMKPGRQDMFVYNYKGRQTLIIIRIIMNIYAHTSP